MIELAADITPEELQVFLQDTDEQLQLLDEDIIKLENESDNEELLQEIFRAAHTIKGSSAMLGYQKMADLTHAMENILDKLRHGELSVTTSIADALLNGLDDLRILHKNLTSSEENDIDVISIIAELNELANGEADSKDDAVSDEAETIPATVSLNEDSRKRLLESLSIGNKAYQIGVDVEKESAWASVRFFQVLNDLAEKGIIIGSNPTQEEVEAEKSESHLELVFAGTREEDEIQEILNLIPDIEKVRIDPYIPDSASTANNVTSNNTTPDVAAIAEEIIASEAKSKTRQSEISGKDVKVSETVRIDVDRLDSLMNQIGEMVVARTRLNQLDQILTDKYKDDSDILSLSKTFTHITKVVDELQLDITAARMLPVGTVFTRFPRLVRDLSQKAGKKIEFIMEGQETGIDRSVIEHIRDPLVHLLRNSVDHGVETPEKRKVAGKPTKAVVRLAAAHEQNYIAITVEDDGKGIDGAALKRTSVEKGILSADAAARMSDAEAVDLIFEAGLSTAEKITDVSGRGVGMDIVRQNIEAMNGNITVETKVGEGTKFTLKLPLTLATIHGLLVSSGETIYAAPMVSVIETLRAKPEEIQTLRQRDVIRLRDKIIPLLKLDKIFERKTENNHSDGMIHIVVVKAGERTAGIVVDSLMAPQELVVKSLGSFVGNTHGIAGASILGSGEVALIIDIPSLVKLATIGE
ncbi:MAG: chemotaxis protein CheA [Chloroflexota bacterium]|nr:chemotaxis protein CheA [Chloroflexota bacterium]